jgi:hypothetical protein
VCSPQISLGSHPQSYHVWCVGNAVAFGWESWTICTIFEQYQTKAKCFISPALKRTKDHKCNSHQVHFLWNFSHGEPHFSSNTYTKSNPEKCGCTYWVLLGTVVVVITPIHWRRSRDIRIPGLIQPLGILSPSYWQSCPSSAEIYYTSNRSISEPSSNKSW